MGKLMGKIIDFNEAKSEKDGRITPLAVAESVVEYIRNNPGSVGHLAIVARNEDGRINTAMSTMNYLELIGLHATAQAMAVEDMTEPI